MILNHMASLVLANLGYGTLAPGYIRWTRSALSSSALSTAIAMPNSTAEKNAVT